MTANPPDHGFEPADLSELTATDALLDRLGLRAPTAEDLLDPTAAALAELLAEVDADSQPDLALGRLVEVLAGRPLYLDETTPSLAGPAKADEEGDGADRVIDLTDHAEALTIDLAEVDDAAADDVPSVDVPPSDVPSVDVPAAAVDVPAGDGGPGASGPPTRPLPQLIPFPAGRRRVEHLGSVLSHVPLPAAAAAVILLLALGGGVSAAVTGNPLAPVDGVSQVVAKLPGIDSDSDRTLKHAKGEILAATQALHRHDMQAVDNHLAAARRDLNNVPNGEKQALQERITSVAAMTTPLATPTDAAPTSGSGNPVTTSPPPLTTKPTDGPPTSVPPTTTSPTSTTPPVQATTTEPVEPTETPTSPESVLNPTTSPPAAASTPTTTDDTP